MTRAEWQCCTQAEPPCHDGGHGQGAAIRLNIARCNAESKRSLQALGARTARAQERSPDGCA
eukprot:14993990-Alexandrium_andersonii.AAC.1